MVYWTWAGGKQYCAFMGCSEVLPVPAGGRWMP